MNSAKRLRQLARQELRSIFTLINDEWDASWLNGIEFDFWLYVSMYRSDPDSIAKLNLSQTLKNLIPKLSDASTKASGWYAFGLNDVIFVPEGPWRYICKKYVVDDRSAAEKAVERFDENLFWRKQQKREETSKWYRWRNKNGPKARRKSEKFWRKTENQNLIMSLANPIRRSLNYEAIGRAALKVTPLGGSHD